MNVSLTPTLEEYVRRKVESGLYNTASEVVREALRNFMNQELSAKNAVKTEVPVKQEIIDKLKSLEQPLREQGITSLSLFGSVARGHGQADSDIDILVEIDRKSDFDIVNLVGVENFLKDHLYRKVDVVVKDSVKPRLIDSIFHDAEKIFRNQNLVWFILKIFKKQLKILSLILQDTILETNYGMTIRQLM